MTQMMNVGSLVIQVVHKQQNC